MLPSKLIVRMRHHSTLPTGPLSSFRPNAPKPAKPLGLKSTPSVVCARNAYCQSHSGYLACFQCLKLEKGPLFSKRIDERSEIRRSSCAGHDMSCVPSHSVVTCQCAGIENMPTDEAGMSFKISSVTGKSLIGCRLAVVGSRLTVVANPTNEGRLVKYLGEKVGGKRRADTRHRGSRRGASA